MWPRLDCGGVAVVTRDRVPVQLGSQPYVAVLLQSSTLLVTAIGGVKSGQNINFLKTSSGPLGSQGGSSEPTEPPCLRACVSRRLRSDNRHCRGRRRECYPSRRHHQ